MIYDVKNGNSSLLKNIIENLKDGDKVVIHSGVYQVEDGLYISNIKDVEIKAQGEVKFIGGKVLSTADFLMPEEKIIKRISPEILSRVRRVKIDKPFGKLGIIPPLEITVNSKISQMAKYPKTETMTFSKVTYEGNCLRNGVDRAGGGRFISDDEHVAVWGEEAVRNMAVDGFFGISFCRDILPVKSIHGTEIELGENSYWGLRIHPLCRFFAFNVLEEMTAEDEYYLDYDSNSVYFVLPEDYDDEKYSIVAAMADNPLITLISCDNVSINGIIFESGLDCGVHIIGGNKNLISDCIVRNMCRHAIEIGCKPEDKLPRGYVEDTDLHKSYNLNAGENHIVSGCRIYENGAGGVILRGGYRPLIKSGNSTVINCEIYKCNRLQKVNAPLIRIEGVGNKIQHCSLHDNLCQAILLFGNEHLIEYNDIFRVCTEADDNGAFYMGCDATERGNVLRYNYFHDIKPTVEIKTPIKDGFGVFSVYCDDGASGIEIYGNIFYRGGNWAIANNGGSDIKVNNNIIIQSLSCIWHTSNLYKRFSEEIMPRPEIDWPPDSPSWYKKYLNVINVLEEPYVSKYPELKNLFRDEGYPIRNEASNNVIYQCMNLMTTWDNQDQLMINVYHLKKPGESDYDVLKRVKIWYEQKNNIISSELKFLDDFENKDFDEINAEIQKLNQAFEPILFDSIGLLR